VSTLLIVLLAALSVLAVAGVVIVRRRGSTPGSAKPEAPTRPVPGAGVTQGLGGRIRALVGHRALDEVAWDQLERTLIEADTGPRAAEDLVRRVRDRLAPGDDPAAVLIDEVEAVLVDSASLSLPGGRLGIVLVVGVNGAGKTTTIGKLAHRLAGEGRTVCLANSDTFRAAASEQLGVWANRAGVQLVAQARGADPGAVAFDAVESARARGANVLIVDTAGRLHTRTPLMDELAKVKRVLEKAAGGVDEVLLVLDATTGQNGIAQARVFTEAVDVTGVVLTKLDGTARGGVVLAVREELGVPVKLIGTGERAEDLQPFDPRAFAERLVND
jgi:fused signal recognition particle receptor